MRTAAFDLLPLFAADPALAQKAIEDGVMDLIVPDGLVQRVITVFAGNADANFWRTKSAETRQLLLSAMLPPENLTPDEARRQYEEVAADLKLDRAEKREQFLRGVVDDCGVAGKNYSIAFEILAEAVRERDRLRAERRAIG